MWWAVPTLRYVALTTTSAARRVPLLLSSAGRRIAFAGRYSPPRRTGRHILWDRFSTGRRPRAGAGRYGT